MNVNQSDNDVTVTQPAYVPDSTDKNIITACQQSFGKVMFLHLCHSVWGRCGP